MPSLDEPLLINFKQYERILKRREQRSKINAVPKFIKQKDKVIIKLLYYLFNFQQKYVHESRHKHAVKRERGKGGRFLSNKGKDEKIEDEENL